MKIYCDTTLEQFEAWSGGEDTLEELREKDLCDRLEQIIECDIYPDGCTDTELNDLLWFERDTIADWLGFSDWEDLENDGEEEEEEEEIEIEYERGATEQEFETADDFCDHYNNDCDACPYKDCVSWEECEQRFNMIVNQMV